MADPWNLRDVELFASGIYRGIPYTVADLEEILRNTKKLGPSGKNLIAPPGVIGHEENQVILQRSDLPAAGWVDTDSLRLRKYYEPATKQTEAVLVGDIVDVPEAVASWINQRKYKRVSAEIYEDFRDDFENTYGKTLRRIAILGAEVPQVKRIANLPKATRFSENRTLKNPWKIRPSSINSSRGLTVIFSEVSMDPKQLILAAMPSLNPATLDAMSPEQLADLVKNLPQMPAQAMPPQQFDEDGMTRDEMIAALVGMGEPAENFDEMDDEEIQALYDEMMADEQPVNELADMTREEMEEEIIAQEEATAEELAEMSDEEVMALFESTTTEATEENTAASTVAAMSERRGMLGRTHQVARANLKMVMKLHKSGKRQDAIQFCEELVRQGRMFPAQKPIFLRTLLQEDNIKVRKFKEGKTYKVATPYEAYKAKLKRMPVLFREGERIVGSSERKSQVSAEVQKVVAFCERHADQLLKLDQDPQRMINLAKTIAAKNPKFKAETLIGHS